MADPDPLLDLAPLLDHDVVIVGAGPVGLLLACLLAQDGIDVVVCERRQGEDRRSRAIGIHPPGLEALAHAGLASTFRAEALALEGGDVLSRGRVLASLDFPEDRPVLVLPQQRTHALLRERLASLSGTALRPGCTARAIRDEGRFVRVTVDAAERRRELTAAFVVIADGVRSGFRRELGMGWDGRPGRAVHTMLDVDDATAGTRALLHCEPDGLVESFPLPGGRRRWVVRGDRDGVAEGFRDDVAARTGTAPVIPADARPTAFVAAQHLARTIVRGRTALLGDAAHEVSPIGGQGMNLGWLDADRLASAIRTALAQGSPDLRQYARRVPRSARASQARSAFYMAMGAPAGGLPLLARETLIRALGSAPLSAWATGLVTMRGL